MARYALTNSTTGFVENIIEWDGLHEYKPTASDGQAAQLTLITPANVDKLQIYVPPADSNQ